MGIIITPPSPGPFIFIFLHWGPSFLELTCHRLQGPRYCPVQTAQVIDEKAEARSSEGDPRFSGRPFGCSAAVLSPITVLPSPSTHPIHPETASGAGSCQGLSLVGAPQSPPW